MERGRIQGLPNFLGVPPIISGTGKATGFKFGTYTHGVHLNNSPRKISQIGERGRFQGLSNFSDTSYYLRNGKSYGFQIWPVHSWGPSE